MTDTPYELYLYVKEKGYIPPMAGQITIDSLSTGTKDSPKLGFSGTGEHLKQVMEADRRNVFKCFFGAEAAESTWIAGDEPGRGMEMPSWAERLIHAEVLLSQEKIDSSMDYLLHRMGVERMEKQKK